MRSFGGSKSKKKLKIAKKCNIVFGFFWQQYWSQRAENLQGLSLHYGLQMSFYKDFSILEKNENQSSPPNNNNNIDCSMVWASSQTKMTVTAPVCISCLRYQQRRLLPGSHVVIIVAAFRRRQNRGGLPHCGHLNWRKTEEKNTI